MSMTMEVPWGYLKVCRGSTVLEGRGVGLLGWMKRWEWLAMALLHVFEGSWGLASLPSSLLAHVSSVQPEELRPLLAEHGSLQLW